MYPIPRFVSAYGLQSIPKIESFQKDTSDPTDSDFESDFFQDRQHVQNGFVKMKKVVEYQTTVHVDKNNKEKSTRGFIYYSQVSVIIIKIPSVEADLFSLVFCHYTSNVFCDFYS